MFVLSFAYRLIPHGLHFPH
jgi:hypothetical protein